MATEGGRLGRCSLRSRRPRRAVHRLGLALVLLLLVSAAGTVLLGAWGGSVPAASLARFVPVPTVPHPLGGYHPSLTLSPSNGSVGTIVTANGTGYLPGSTVIFSVGGEALASSCTADSSGNFPGSTGSNCTFQIPDLPGGAQPVSATGGWTAKNSSVGQWPDAVVYDPTANELFVTNSKSANVSVVNASSDSVVANIGVGVSPIEIAYDAGKGTVYVSNTDPSSNDVSVISAASNKVVKTFTTDTRPLGIAYVAPLGEVFIGNSGADDVSVVNDTANAVVATVGVGSWPVGVAYDPVEQAVYVVNAFSDNVTVISTATDKVVANIAIGSNPYNIAYDSARGEMFVDNFNADTVSVINDSTNQVAATIRVGSAPVELAYDPLAGEILVSNIYSNNISVISDATNSVVAWAGTGDMPAGIAYAQPLDTAFIALQMNGTTTGRLTALKSISGTTPFAVDPVVAAPVSVEMGQAVPISGNGFAASSNLTTFSLDGAGVACTSATVGACVGGVVTTSPLGHFAVDARIPALSAAGTYSLRAVDAAGNSVAVWVAVATNPSAAAPVATPRSVDLGQSVTFSTSVAGGTGPYAYRWFGLPSGCASANASSVTCTPAAISTSSIFVNVTDGHRFVTTSAPLAFVVHSDPFVASFSASPWTVDEGSTATFFAQAAGGSNNYTYLWVGLPAGCVGTAALVTCVPAAAGNFSIWVEVTDSNNFTVLSSVENFEVLPTYAVTFNETGLPAGMGWGVALGGQIETSDSASLSFLVLNGTYLFVVLEVNGYVTNSSGSVTVTGLAQTVDIAFRLETYPVVFIEFGLPAGSNWSVSVLDPAIPINETRSSVGASILFFLPNGTYTIRFLLPPGYTSNATTTQITVAGALMSTKLGVTHIPSASWGSDLMASPLFLGSLIAAAGLVGSLLIVRNGRRPPPPRGRGPPPGATGLPPKGVPANTPSSTYDRQDPLNSVF